MDNSCELFIWDDEITNSESFCKQCDLAMVKYDLIERKLEKSKLKQAGLKRKIFQLNVALFLSWIVFAVMYDYM